MPWLARSPRRSSCSSSLPRTTSGRPPPARRVPACPTPRSSGTIQPIRSWYSFTIRLGGQNIRLLVPIVLEPESPSYARWKDLVLLTLCCYALDNHVLLDAAGAVPTASWLRLDSIVLSWILGTISLDLHDLVRNTPNARGA
jgi:hypothetical protein